MAVIEKDEANGWAPVVLANKIVKIIELTNPRQRYVIGSYDQKLAVLLKYLLPGKLFRLILQDHYKIK
jgi:rhamnogalacturonyl hydrolase YesR